MMKRQKAIGTGTIVALAIAVILIGIVAGVAGSSTVTADTSNIAILVNPFDRTVTDGPIGPAIIYFGKAPWVEVHQVPLSTQSILMATLPQSAETRPKTPDIVVLSKDGLTIEVELNIRYSVQPSKAHELFLHYPKLDYETQIINIVRESVRNVVVQFNAVDLIEKRQQLDAPMRDTITSKITSDSSLVGAINVSGIELLKIDPPQTFKDAIASKLSAQQQSQAALFTRNQTLTNADAAARATIRTAEAQRDAAILAAEGTANATIIQSQASARATVIQAEAAAKAASIQAEGQKSAILTVSSGIGGNQVEAAKLYLQLQTMQKIGENGKTVFIITKDGQGNLLLLPFPGNPQ